MTIAMQMSLLLRMDQMSDIDFEVIDQCNVEISRNRKSKYSTKLWEYDNEKDHTRYMIAVLNLNIRRNSTNCEDLISRINKRYAYEIEMENVFHSDEEVPEEEVINVDYVSDCLDVELDPEILENLNAIVELKYISDFVVMSGFEFDSKSEVIFARVPSGVVSKKMTLQDIYDKYETFSRSSAFINMKDEKRKVIMTNWILNANKVLTKDICYAVKVYSSEINDIETMEIY